MKSKMIMTISFLTVSSILLSECQAQYSNYERYNIEKKHQKQCICLRDDGTTVPDNLHNFYRPSKDHYEYERLIVYLYRDILNNATIIHISSRNKQKLLPDMPVDDDDVRIPLTEEKVHDLFMKYPEHVTTETNVAKPSKLQKLHFPDSETADDFEYPMNIINPVQLKEREEVDDQSQVKVVNKEPGSVEVVLEYPIQTQTTYKPKIIHIEPVHLVEQNPKHTVNDIHGTQVPTSHPLHLIHIEPTVESEHQVQVPIPSSHQSIHFKDPVQNPEHTVDDFYGTQVPTSHLLHPIYIEPIKSIKEKPENPDQVPTTHPPHTIQMKPAISFERYPEHTEDDVGGTQVPTFHSLDPIHIEPTVKLEHQVHVSNPTTYQTIHFKYPVQNPEHPVHDVQFINELNPFSLDSIHNETIKSNKKQPEHPNQKSTINSPHIIHIEPVHSVEHIPERTIEDIHGTQVPTSHPLHLIHIEPTFEPEHQVPVPNPNTHQSIHFKHPVQNPEHSVDDVYGTQVPTFHPLHPNHIKPTSHLLHPFYIEPIKSNEVKPENPDQVPTAHPPHTIQIKPYISFYQNPEHTVDDVYGTQVPTSHHLHPIHIEPTDETEHQVQVPNPKTHELIHFEHPVQNPEHTVDDVYGTQVPTSHHLHPIYIEPTGETEHQVKVPNPKTHQLIHFEHPVQNPEHTVDDVYGTQVPTFHSLHPIHIEPTSHLLHPIYIEPIKSNEEKPENPDQVPTTHPSHTIQIKPSVLFEQNPEHTEDDIYSTQVPTSQHLHPIHIEPTGETDHQVLAPNSKTQQLIHFEHSVQDPEHTVDVVYGTRVPTSHHLHPIHIGPIVEPEHQVQVPNLTIHQLIHFKHLVQNPEHTVDDVYGTQVPTSHHLHPIHTEPTGETEHQVQVPNPKTHQLIHFEHPVQNPEHTVDDVYGTQVPTFHHLHPIHIGPIVEAEHQVQVPNLTIHQLIHFKHPLRNPDHIVNDVHGTQVLTSDPLYSINTKLIQKHENPAKDIHRPKAPSSYALPPIQIEPDHSLEVPHSHPFHPSEVKLIGSGLMEKPGYYVPASSTDVKPIISGFHKPCLNCAPTDYHYKLQIPPYLIQNQVGFKFPIKPNTSSAPKVFYDIYQETYKIQQDSLQQDSLPSMTFDQWFREEMHKLKHIDQKVNVNYIGRAILKTLLENGIYITYGGVLYDRQGKIGQLQNLKLRLTLIGESMSFDKFINRRIRPSQEPYTDDTWSKFVILTTVNPHRTLGVIPLDTSTLRSSGGLKSLSSLLEFRNNPKLWSNVIKKGLNERQLNFNLVPQKVDSLHNILRRDISADNIEDDGVKDDKSLEESVENFLRNMPHYSHTRRAYVDRNDSSLDDPLYLGNASAEFESNVSSLKSPNKNKKYFYDYLNEEDFNRDESLVRIIGGKAAIGSGPPLSNRGRSGAHY